MAVTYDISTDRGKVRFLVGDTDVDDAFLQDDEIDLCLTLTSSVVRDAAVRACRAIMAKLARDIDTGAGGLNSRKTSRFAQYKELLAELESDAPLALTPFAGGISIDRQDTADEDTDFRPHAFGIGMHDSANTDDDPTEA